MKLFPFLLLNLAGLAILHFAWIPSVERRFRMDRTMATIKRAGLLSLLGFFRSVFLVATLTTALLIVILFILGMRGGVTAGEVTSAIESIHRWRALVISVGPVWGWIVMAMLILALGIYSRRSGRRNMAKAFQKMYARKFEELRREYELGKLKEMPPTAEMRDVAKKIGEINKILASLESETVRDDPTTPVAREHLNEQITLLQKYYVALDMQRRIDLELDPDEAALPEARTKWEKFQTFFISRGLLASLNGASRAIFLTSLILLVPSLISVYSVSTAAALNHRLVQLKDLRVELSRKEFEQEKARLGEPTNELSEQDKHDLQEVARSYEQSVSPQVMATGIRISINSMRSTLVREAILTRAATQANVATEQRAAGANWQQHASGSGVQELTALEREVVLAPEKAIKMRGPVTPQGQRVYSQLEDIARRSPSFMEKVRTGVRSFQKPASSYDISHALFNQMAGTLADDSSPELGNAIRSLTTNRRHPTFNGFTEMQSREFLSDLMGGSSLDDAMRRTATSESRYPFLGRLEKLEFHSTMRTVTDDLPLASLNEKLSAYPPTVDVLPEQHVNMQKAAEAVTRFRNRAPDSLIRTSRGSAESLVGFSDWFPAQVGLESKTVRGELLTQLEPKLPSAPRVPLPPEVPGRPAFPRVPGPRVPPGGGSSWLNFLRGRNFGWLRGFSRIGGVLIGQSVKEDATPKARFADLRWDIDGSHIRFVLVGEDGKQIRSRPYRTSIAYQALNYAADGRPLAVTMVTAKPLLELRILLHPTLVDTPLGQRIIELDRFVDAYTVMTQARTEAQNRVEAHNLLYRFAWNVRALAYLGTRRDEGDMGQKIRDAEKELSETLNDQNYRAAARSALEELGTISDSRQSPLTVKKEFYDQTLVEILAKAPPTTTLDSLTEAIRANVTQQLTPVIESGDKERWQALDYRWLSSAPDFVVWSGVRERDFDTNPVNFLVAEGAAMPMPFDFMLQVAFTSPPPFIDAEAAETYTDTEPWEFPVLREMIQTTVLEKTSSDPQAKSILEDSIEFTMLQRLFRMALNGQLGENFPLEKMIELDQALSTGAPQTMARTLRWHSSLGGDLIQRALEFKQAKSETQRFAITLMVQRTSGEDGLAVLKDLLSSEIADLELIEEIRQQLGVARDEEQARKELGVPLAKLE